VIEAESHQVVQIVRSTPGETNDVMYLQRASATSICFLTRVPIPRQNEGSEFGPIDPVFLSADHRNISEDMLADPYTLDCRRLH